ncbi:hypothetical protein Tco_0982529 [Tanacetum coccineum]
MSRCYVMHVDVEFKCVLPANDNRLGYAELEQSYIDEYNLEPLSPKLRKNRKAHVDYLNKAKEHVDTLRNIVEQARAQKPLDSALEYACKFTTRIQELLVYVSATCPSSLHVNKKLVAIIPINKSKKVRFEEPNNSTSNTPTQADSQNSKITNQPLLTSTGVKSSTSASGSQPSGNTKKNRILRTTSSNHKNKHSSLNVNSELICATCNECMFDAIHDLRVLDYLNDVNVRVKPKSVKSNKKKDWKPTAKVFTNVGYRWIPTGRTFTIDGNKCPLTRITSTIVVPPMKTVPAKVVKKTLSSSNNQGTPKP